MSPPSYPSIPGRPLVLGHRGASAEAPENTLAAFRRSRELGADGFELDVWRCGTGEAVVIHDADTARTGQAALAVRHASLPRLRELDVGRWKGEASTGEWIPTLSEVLEAFPDAVVNVEMKSRGDGDLRLAGALAALLSRRGDGGWIVVSYFDWRLLRTVTGSSNSRAETIPERR